MKIKVYIFKSVLRLSLAIMAALTLIILTIQIISRDDLLVAGTVNFVQLLLLAFLAMIETFGFLLMVTFVTAIYLTRQNLAANHEYIILKATGFLHRQFLQPIYVFLGIVMLCSYSLTLYITPEALHLQSQKLHEYKNQALRTKLISGRFFTPEKGLTLYIGDIDHRSSKMHDIYIFDKRAQPAFFLTSAYAQFFDTPKGIRMKFISGTHYHFFDPANPQERFTPQHQLRVIDFQEFWFNAAVYDERSKKQDVLQRKLKSQKTIQIIKDLAKPDIANDKDAKEYYQLELHKRFHFPLLILVLTGFILLVPISPLQRGHHQGWRHYAVILGAVSLIVIQIFLLNTLTFSAVFISYMLAILFASLPWLMKEGRL